MPRSSTPSPDIFALNRIMDSLSPETKISLAALLPGGRLLEIKVDAVRTCFALFARITTELCLALYTGSRAFL